MKLILFPLSVLSIAVFKAMASHQIHQRHPDLHLGRRWSGPPPSLTDPLVFAHYMITFQPPNGDYTDDIKQAKAAGIDAFAVNYGGINIDWTMLATQLDRFYNNASALDFKLFMSYDTDVMSDPKMMVNISNTYRFHPAQLWVDDKIFLSSFSGGPPPFDWQRDVLDRINGPVLFMPATLAEDAEYTAQQGVGSGPFTWVHPASNVAAEAKIDLDYSEQRAVANKPWMAGIAPWFFRRMAEDQNWLHAQGMGMWLDRWMHLLQLRPNFIEIITWNDFGESSYVGPTTGFHDSDLIQKDCFYGGLDHSGFLKMAKTFINAYKHGVSTNLGIPPQEEDVFMWYRLQPAKINGKNDAWPLPKNASDCEDVVNVVSFLSNPATVYLKSGGVTKQLNCPAGISNFTVPWTFGNQSLSMNRRLGSGSELSKTGPAILPQLKTYQGNVVAL